MQSTNTFQIGLTMAGAVSAGAYTAGVVDFLIEALDEWQKALAISAPETPDHGVNLRVMSGASAGALTAAIVAANCRVAFPPIKPGSAATQGPLNPLFTAWVDRIDISELLKQKDLVTGARPESLLDSTIIDEIGDEVLKPPSSATPLVKRAYIAECLRVLCTLTNVTGIPYLYRSRGSGRYAECMTAHGDFIRFAVRGSGTGTSPPPRTAEGWNHEYVIDISDDAVLLPLLKGAAIASAAFPLGLRPRQLTRNRSDYNDRPVLTPAQDSTKGPVVTYIEPTWLPGAPISYNFVNFDGGCIDNDPFELARTELSGGLTTRNERDGAKADRAVIMIDPFPGSSPVIGPQAEAEIPLQVAPFTLLEIYKEHARFSPEELALALDDDVYSRFLIAPVRSAPSPIGQAPDSTNPGPWIASGALGGFSGFLSKEYRLHDYFLGRRNCQQFLRNSFSLKIENALFDSWRDAPWASKYYIAASEGTKHWIELPIIPLMSAVTAAELEPQWPYQKFSPDSIRGAVSSRLDALFQRWLEGESLMSKVAKLAWSVWGRGFATTKALNIVTAALVAQRLLPPAAPSAEVVSMRAATVSRD